MRQNRANFSSQFLVLKLELRRKHIPHYDVWPYSYSESSGLPRGSVTLNFIKDTFSVKASIFKNEVSLWACNFYKSHGSNISLFGFMYCTLSYFLQFSSYFEFLCFEKTVPFGVQFDLF